MADRPIREWNGMSIPDPGVYILDEAHKRLGFVAQHMMVSPVRGEFATGAATIVIGEDPLQTTISATIRSGSLNTHNPDRDVHLKSGDFLDVERYPTLEFRSTGVKWQGGNDAIFYWARLRQNKLGRRAPAVDVPEVAARSAGRFVVTGDLTIKDVTQHVDLQVEFGGARRDPYGRDIFGFSASADIDRESYGLVWNVVLETGGVLVGKKVRIELAGEAIHQPAY
jgi:polyisoprenoid-binding protein YceI